MGHGGVVCHGGLDRWSNKTQVDLYIILPLPVLYCVCHTKGGRGGGRTERNSRAIVLQ